ncbi:uncharacterized protein LOC136090429 isoform X1 [Hydra vulgaris]|uniref:Uncharacterized protein LOC136090429 isoform X1 n=1 Tax=Hydra vulgaris TaxID=6087 RepID=A0ABM4DFC1_HYDVU
MGHSKDFNQNVYQVPPALLEITKVGRHLIDIEKGKHKVVNRTVLQAPTSDGKQKVANSNVLQTSTANNNDDLKENTNDSIENGKNTDTLSRWKTNKRVNLDEENESGLDEKKKKRKKTDFQHNKEAESNTGRSYFQWNTYQINHFDCAFGSFINGVNQNCFPELKYMKEFSKRYNVDLHKIRTRINNERRKTLNLQKKRMKQMHISE